MASTTSAPVLVEKPGARSDRILDGRGLKIAIISTHWFDKEVNHALVQACKDELLHKGVASDDITQLYVPGVFELPFAASRVIHAKKKRLDAVICIGCMVKGASMAYEFVSEAAVMGLMKLNVQTETPVVCGILTCQSMDEAAQCATATPAHATATTSTTTSSHGGGPATSANCNHGVEWAQEALELARLKRATAEMIETKCACACHCKQQKCSCSCHCKQCKCRACSCPPGKCTCTGCFSSHETEKATTTTVASETAATKTDQPSQTLLLQQFKNAMQGNGGSKASCGGCKKPQCEQCGGRDGGKERGDGAAGEHTKSEATGYHGRSSAPLKGQPNTETMP